MTASDVKKFSERTAQAVGALETAADLDLVVAVAPRSGSYADVDLRWAILWSLATLLFMVHSDVQFEWGVLDTILVGLMGWGLSRLLPGLRRALTGQARRQRQVREAACVFFWERRLAATRERRVALIFLSLLERRAEVIVDVGIEGAVPGALWNEVRQRLNRGLAPRALLEALFAELDCLRQQLPAYLPAPAQRADQIPDAPVMLT